MFELDCGDEAGWRHVGASDGYSYFHWIPEIDNRPCLRIRDAKQHMGGKVVASAFDCDVTKRVLE